MIEMHIVACYCDAAIKHLKQRPCYLAKSRCNEDIARAESMKTRWADVSIRIDERLERA
jgi:hypothetical protein